MAVRLRGCGSKPERPVPLKQVTQKTGQSPEGQGSGRCPETRQEGLPPGPPARGGSPWTPSMETPWRGSRCPAPSGARGGAPVFFPSGNCPDPENGKYCQKLNQPLTFLWINKAAGGIVSMAGVSTATLTSWAIPMGIGPWEHTYVTSSCGLLWGCYGRSAGGRPLSTGTGSSIIAHCLSQPNSQAGLRYGRDGVCHQMANRILHPAGQITVAGCNGYNISTFRYGVYGRGNWIGLTTCYPLGTAVAGQGGVSHGQQGDIMTSADAYGQIGSESQMALMGRVRELERMVTDALGHPLDNIAFFQLAMIQAELWRSDIDLEHRLGQNQIDPQECLQRMNEALAVAMRRSMRVLGPEQFYTVFGEAARHTEGLISGSAGG